MKSPVADNGKTIQFGHRRTAPRVCVVDGKPHIRTFLAEALEDLGFVTHQCGYASDVTAALRSSEIDVVLLGLLTPESDVTKVLHTLALERYPGKLMLFGGRASTALLGLHDLAERIGLAMLSPLLTPFRDSDLQENLSAFLPILPSPSAPIDVEEALHNRWLELWYEPKIDLKQMSLHAAEAQVRMRHPAWGVVPPKSFISSPGDPQMRGLADFVIRQAISDWGTFVKRQPGVGLVVPMPIAVLEDVEFIDRLCLELPDHAGTGGLTVEISSVEASRDAALVRSAARRLEAYNVDISIDDVTAEVSWVDLGDFPIAELQVDASFVRGCADDRKKRTVCGMVRNIAERLGARTAAKGLDSTADFQAICEMGFDLGQGALFAKPVPADKFARVLLRGQPAPAK